MGRPSCGVCGSQMVKNGTTSAGVQRWRCRSCGSSQTRRIDNASKLLKGFVGWLLGKLTQEELGMPARTFRDKTRRFWSLWPILPICDEIHHVVYMDGLWIAKDVVLLIASTDEFVIGCHLARSENSKDWGCLMRRIAPPDVLVCDGAGGIEKARRAHWPATRVQRCLFHVFNSVKRCTTTRPKLQAGAELYGVAKVLLHVTTLNEAAEWLVTFQRWCSSWEEFLKEKTIVDGRRQYKHERLRKARRILEALCREGTLFTYLDEELLEKGPIASTTNKIESNNAAIRAVLRTHRGMRVDHRIKAVFWHCYMGSETPRPFAELVRMLPSDADVLTWRRKAAQASNSDEDLARWGQGIVWAEFHKSGSKATGWF